MELPENLGSNKVIKTAAIAVSCTIVNEVFKWLRLDEFIYFNKQFVTINQLSIH